MTDPRIPDTAIRAATLAHHNRFCLSKDSDWHTGEDAEACVNDYRATTEIILAAALPLLGETEYAVHCTENGRYVPARGRDAAIGMTRWGGCQGDHTIVTRTVTEWTEDTSE